MIGFVLGIRERDDERELGQPLGYLRCVPRRDRWIRAVADPHVGRRHARPVLGCLLLEQPRQMRRTERRRPRRIGHQRHQRLVGVADVRLPHPAVARRLVELILHQAVGTRQYRADARNRRTHELDRRAECATRHFERTDQDGEHRPRPAGVVATPAVVDRLADHDRHRPERQGVALDLDRLANAGVRQIFIGDTPDRVRRHAALLGRPVGRIALHVLEEDRERRPCLRLLVFDHFIVGTVLDASQCVFAVQRRILQARIVVDLVLTVGQIVDQRLAAFRVAQEPTVRADQIRRAAAVLQERNVAHLGPAPLVHHAVNQTVEKGSVGLRTDRHPLCRQRAGHRQMRLHLHPLGTAHARIGLTPDADHAAGGLDVVAAVDDVVDVRSIGRHDERPVPQFTVQVLGVIALHSLAGTVSLVDRSPCRHEGREGSHVLHGRTAATGRGCQARCALLIQQALGPNLAQFCANDVQRLVPTDRHETGILVAALLRVGPLHRLADPVRVVRLLDQAIGLDADTPPTRMSVTDVVVRLDALGHAILDFDLHQIGASHALVAVHRNFLYSHADPSCDR